MPTRSKPNSSVCASAPPNLALSKYWGKRDARLNLPAMDSVSVCLDGPRTHVALRPAESLSVRWNGRALPTQLHAPYGRLLAVFGPAVQSVQVDVSTRLPVASGMAGSAAVMAALAVAAAHLAGDDESPAMLGCAARLGSGSATRSVPDGFCYWPRGVAADGSDSYATSFAGPDHWPELRVCAVVLADGPKAVSSTKGMALTAATSPRYGAWVDEANRRAPEIRDLLLARDFAGLARIALPHAMAMHEACHAASPPLRYVTEPALALLEKLDETMADGSWFASFDAGTNPLLFTLADELPALEAALARLAPSAPRFTARPGVGARLEAAE